MAYLSAAASVRDTFHVECTFFNSMGEKNKKIYIVAYINRK